MVSVSDPALFGIAYAMLGPFVSEGAVVLEGAVQAFAYAMLGSLGFGGGVVIVLETFMRTRTKCPCSRASAGACSAL